MEHVVWWALTNVGFLHAIVSGGLCNMFYKSRHAAPEFGRFIFVYTRHFPGKVCSMRLSQHHSQRFRMLDCDMVPKFVDRAVYCLWCKKPVHFAVCQESYHEWMVADTAPKQLNVAENIGSQYLKAWRYHCCWENCSCRNTVEILSVSLKASSRCLCLYPSILYSNSVRKTSLHGFLFVLTEALGYLQKCPEFSLPRAVATRAVGALGSQSLFSSVFNQRCWTCCSVGGLTRGGMAAAHGKIKKKYGMENERDALFTAVEVPSLSEDSEDDKIRSPKNICFGQGMDCRSWQQTLSW